MGIWKDIPWLMGDSGGYSMGEGNGANIHPTGRCDLGAVVEPRDGLHVSGAGDSPDRFTRTTVSVSYGELFWTIHKQPLLCCGHFLVHTKRALRLWHLTHLALSTSIVRWTICGDIDKNEQRDRIRSSLCSSDVRPNFPMSKNIPFV